MSCTPSIITGKHIHAVTCLPCHDISLIPKLVVQYVPGIMLSIHGSEYHCRKLYYMLKCIHSQLRGLPEIAKSSFMSTTNLSIPTDISVSPRHVITNFP